MKLTSRKILAYSLFGTDEKYWAGFLNAVRDAPSVYPGWQVVVYIEKNHFLLPVLRELGISYEEEVFVPGDKYYGARWGALWRFYAFELDADFIETRDCDFVLSETGYKCTEEWVNSGYPAHIIRYFDTEQPLFGGLSGIRGGIVKNVRQLADEYVHSNEIASEYHSDEDFLRDRIVAQIGGRDKILNQGQGDPLGDKDKFTPYPPVEHRPKDFLELTYIRWFKDTFYRYICH